MRRLGNGGSRRRDSCNHPAHRDTSRITSWYQALQMDARFRVTSMANDAQDLHPQLVSSPEVILLLPGHGNSRLWQNQFPP